jgi:FKBP-type peptidyl-prolyl cis-trans isomerase SlyD
MAKLSTIARDTMVTMQYSLCNGDGVVLRAPDGKPIEYLQGSGGLFPKLEAALENRKVGDVLTIRLLPDDAFGRRDPDLVYEVPLSDLPPGEAIEVGGRVLGTDPQGHQQVFIVKSIDDGLVCLDGNNPLAGQTLVFEIEIQGVRAATPEELESFAQGRSD